MEHINARFSNNWRLKDIFICTQFWNAIKSKYSSEWHLKMPSCLDPMSTGGKYWNQNLPGESPSKKHI